MTTIALRRNTVNTKERASMLEQIINAYRDHWADVVCGMFILTIGRSEAAIRMYNNLCK